VVFGAEASRIPPKWIPRIFIFCDVISLIVQGTGGGLAAYYAQQEKMPDNGNFTIIAGLSFQAFTLLIFLIMATDFAIRTTKRVRRHGDQAMNEDLVSRRLRRHWRFQGMIASLGISALLIFMRSIYRVAELTEGWKGELMSNERYVVGLESIPVAIAGLLLSFFHPCTCFKDKPVPIERLEMPETPPTNSSRAIPQAYEEKMRNGTYGQAVLAYDSDRERSQEREVQPVSYGQQNHGNSPYGQNPYGQQSKNPYNTYGGSYDQYGQFVQPSSQQPASQQPTRPSNNYGGAHGRPYPDGFGDYDPKKWKS
jgi:hypothetical protein